MSNRARLIVPASVFLAAGVASASSVKLNDYNVVVTGTMTAKSHVDGKTVVNNLGTSSLSEFGQHVSSGDALDIAGTATGDFKTFRGTLHHDLSLSGANVSYLNGSTQSQDTVASSLLSDLSHAMNSASAAFAMLATSGNTSASRDSSNRVAFSYTGGSTSQAVFNISASLLNGASEISFNLGSAKTAIINVSLAGSSSYSESANFTGDVNNHAGNLLWNFVGTASFNAGTTWEGTILGNNLSLTTGNNVDGGVYVKNFTQGGEVHDKYFTGTIVPLPASVLGGSALLALLGAAQLVRSRRSC